MNDHKITIAEHFAWTHGTRYCCQWIRQRVSCIDAQIETRGCLQRRYVCDYSTRECSGSCFRADILKYSSYL